MLHVAVMEGQEEVVECLLSFEQTEVSVRER